MDEIISKDKKYIAGTYARFPVEIGSGKGSVIYDTDGKKYIDMGSGIGVTSFGISDEEWIKAVLKQMKKIQHASNLYYTKPCADLAEALCEKTGMDKVFFSNSGAEANECAVKAARKYSSDNYGGKRSTVITLKNSFHGRTVTMLAATGQEKFHTLFKPLTPGFEYVKADDYIEFFKACKTLNPCAVMLECIQGEGGVIPLDPEYVKKVAAYCKNNDIVLIIDEVQTGNGRTGALYSYMNYGISPDIVTTAKGLGGGLPIGATLFSKKVSGVFSPGDHGSTFGGNPVSCAGALNVLSRIDGALLAEVKEKSDYIFKELNGADGIESVDGMGLMIGIKTVKPASDVINECMRRGVLCLSAKDRVRLLPALNIPFDLLEDAVNVIKSAAAEA